MAVRTPPSWLQAGSHTAENDRLFAAALVGKQGVDDASAWLPQVSAVKTGDLAVNQAGTPAMSVVVSAGGGHVLGTSTANQGMYYTYNDAAVTLTIATAPTVNTRIDLIVLRINDAAYAGATNSATLEVITGTAAVSPVVPTTPVSSLPLARVLVGTNVTSIVNANITDLRVRAAHQNFVATSAAVGDDSASINVLASQTGYALAIRDSSGNLLNGFTAAGALVVGGGGGSIPDVFMLMGG